MVRCLLLVGPEKWCLNHFDVIHNHNESWLLYDKFPVNENDKKRISEMIEAGNFQIFIYVSKNWGGKGKIEYVAYTPKKKGRRIVDTPLHGTNGFYIDDELIPENNKNMKAGRSEKSAKWLWPEKPPGFVPKWDYYDFGVSRHPFDIGDSKEYMKEHLPRAYNIAIKIIDFRKIEPKDLDEFKNFDDKKFKDKPISIGQLKNSFIIAHTNSDYGKKFKWRS